MQYDYEAYYQKISLMYDKIRLDKKVEFDNTLDVILDGCQGKIGRVLDIGCGSGRYAQALSEKGFKVIGVDKSESQVKEAAKIISAVHCTASQLPFDDNSFDLCTMMMMIHHMSAQERMDAFRDAFRVLSPTGYLIIKTCSHDDLRKRLTSKFWPQTLEIDLLRYPPIEKIVNELLPFAQVFLKNTSTMGEYSKEECLNAYRLRRTSNLGILNDKDFYSGMKRIEEAYVNTEFIRKQFYHTYLIARKRGVQLC